MLVDPQVNGGTCIVLCAVYNLKPNCPLMFSFYLYDNREDVVINFIKIF